ncbi:M20/M25/M40 family metallo-hydrolase [Opitutus terrae]|nr:M20/M25/M40 family metallo-hydrolase [Opitutus terrae]
MCLENAPRCLARLTCAAGLAASLLALSSLTAVTAATEAGPPHAVDRSSGSESLARALLRELVEIDTTPAHGCTKAAEATSTRLRDGGFADAEVQLLGSRPDRQNLVVRVRGSGTDKPILFIAHLDVVDAPREGWHSDPFRLTERDGYFYGRGVGDNKSAAAQLVANLIRLRTERFTPGRDLIVALTADEEAGPANGLLWLLANRSDLMDVAYCLNLDAGGGYMEKGKRRRLTVQTSEKTYLSFRLRTQGEGGHSSLPTTDNPIYRLAAGLTRIASHSFPFRFNETTREYFRRIALTETGARADDLRAVAKDPPDLAAAQRLAASSVLYNSLLHTTCVATRLSAGHADNALPQSAEAILNCRVFPGDTAEFVRQTIEEVLADPKIEVIPLGSGRPSPASPLVPEVWAAVEKLSHARWPEIPVLPVMDPWSSDSAKLRRAGIPTLGVNGTFGDIELGNPHGANERLSIAAFDEGTEFLYELMKILARPAAERN